MVCYSVYRSYKQHLKNWNTAKRLIILIPLDTPYSVIAAKLASTPKGDVAGGATDSIVVDHTHDAKSHH